jgi:hypothetical protein
MLNNGAWEWVPVEARILGREGQWCTEGVARSEEVVSRSDSEM